MDINSIITQIINGFVMLQMKNQDKDNSNFIYVIFLPIILFYLKDIVSLIISKLNVFLNKNRTFKTQLVFNINQKKSINGTEVDASTIAYSILYKYVNSDYCKIQSKESRDLYLPYSYLIKNKYNYNKSSSKDFYTHYILPICESVIHIENDIYFQLKIKDAVSETDKKESIQTTSFILTIFSKNGNIIYLENWLENLHSEYMKFINKDKIDKKYVYVSEISSQQKSIFSQFPFNSTKQFNSIFFEDKEKVLKRLDTYIANDDAVYKNLGIPHTLGFLFHGSPGTGKTSSIKALANYLDRSIITINIKHFKSIDDLRKIFYSEQLLLNGWYELVPFNKRLYVFEEIDCAEKIEKNPFICRSYLESYKKEKESNIESKIKEIVTESPAFTLQDFLELLDGVVENEDRVIVFTTNYPERIDKALLRPGRIDMIIDFKKLRRIDINNYYKLWFDKDIPKDILNSIKDYTISQAELGKLFNEYKDNKSLLLKQLCK